jgi:16S rRNA (uracil1498-N3)-methyltransferase
MIGHLFYHPHASANGTTVMDEEESRHMKAFRLRDGDAVQLTDGNGWLIHGTVQWHKYTAHVHANEATRPETSPVPLTICIAPVKNPDRMEWFVEKATELGVGTIVPIQCANSERSHLKGDRLQRVAIAAMKQSGKVFLPTILPLTSFQEALQATSSEQTLLAHCREELHRTSIREALTPVANTTVFIGPEGDFSLEEIALAKQAGAVCIHLGSSRLRTETAGVMTVTAHYIASMT